MKRHVVGLGKDVKLQETVWLVPVISGRTFRYAGPLMFHWLLSDPRMTRVCGHAAFFTRKDAEEAIKMTDMRFSNIGKPVRYRVALKTQP